MMALLAELTSPEIGLHATTSVLAIPIGSTEQHGPHLPMSTDTDIAAALCERLRSARDDVLVAPALPYGSSGEHAGFPGTLSIGQTALELLIVELCRSAFDTFDRVLLVSAHGGNNEPLTRAVRLLRSESRDVQLFCPRWAGDPHAGHQETSLMLTLKPELVHMDRAVLGDPRPLPEIMPLLRSGGVRAVTETGVLGDPTAAGAEAGRRLLETLTAALLDSVSAWLEPAMP
ncbi:mycofactocin biosynthesis peptidyl-dipeptidase MftE [Nocardia sp. NPDC006630]|uniref:mycofactocin biosynthesis peptidyl-dipeptidase MftE n=1 Tax=Nocardia sp. NPDC006630 TaxID=3157181 RepID=UPI0033AF3605